MILINLVPPTSGGGLQNAVSFVHGLTSIPWLRDHAIVVCPRGQAVHKACLACGVMVEPISPHWAGRAYFEFGGGAAIARRHSAKIVFSLFGNAPILSGGLYRISGFALSNILVPEVQFWSSLPPLRRQLQQIKDRIRLWAVRRSQEIIVETDFLAKRARTGAFHDRIVHVVYMEPSAAVLSNITHARADQSRQELRLLALTGPHPNKRLAAMGPIMAHIARLRADRNLPPARFLVSIDKDHPHARTVAEAFRRAGAAPPKFLGSVPPEAVGPLLGEVDGIVNVARLESFSNNWVEAWAAGLPLISTDAEWARASCGEAAIYVDPECPEGAAALIDTAYASPKSLQALATAGEQQLAKLATQGRKIDAYARLLAQSCARLGLKK